MTIPAHLHTPEARAKGGAKRTANIAQHTPHGPSRLRNDRSDPRHADQSAPERRFTHVCGAHRLRGGVNTEHYDNGCPDYTEIGVTFAIAKDWKRAAADAWFRVDEVERT